MASESKKKACKRKTDFSTLDIRLKREKRKQQKKAWKEKNKDKNLCSLKNTMNAIKTNSNRT